MHYEFNYVISAANSVKALNG